MPANHDCGCEEKTNPHPDNALQLLEALGAEIAKMPSEDLFDLPVGRVRAAFQNVYDVARSRIMALGGEPFAKDKVDPWCQRQVNIILQLIEELKERWDDMNQNPNPMKRIGRPGESTYMTHRHFYEAMQGEGYKVPEGEWRDGLTRESTYLYIHQPPCPQTEALRPLIEEWKSKPAPDYQGPARVESIVEQLIFRSMLLGSPISDAEAWDLAWAQIVDAYPPSRFSYYVCPGCHGGNTWVGPLDEKPNPGTPQWVYAVPGVTAGVAIIAIVGLEGSVIYWLVESGLRLVAR
ncbi:hypothetical protein ANRL4_01687 [Anaerolineae bacterium]|nr:hypothetical protein ANRL4_01687 [Anaerolineae bacterium]